jgi:hypothetical protein
MTKLNDTQAALLKIFAEFKPFARKSEWLNLDNGMSYDDIAAELVLMGVLKMNKVGSLSMGKEGYKITGGHYGQEAEAKRSMWGGTI